MSARLRLAAAALLAAAGLGLLVAAYADDGPPPPDQGDPVPSASEPAAGPSPTAQPRPVRRLRSSVPQPGEVDATGGAGSGAAPIARGESLPKQYPAFEPSQILLRPGGGGTPAPVDPVSVEGRTLQLPVDADRVGWWTGGSRAGEPFGTAVVAGHLDSDTDPEGYLAGLAGLESGDLVELSAGSDRQAYRVTRNYLLPSADLSRRSDLFAQQRRHRLLLITCGGPYDHAQGRYRDNRVVEAVPVAG